MAPRFDLGREARSLAGSLTELLNGTITTGVRVRSLLLTGHDTASLSTGERNVPVSIGRRPTLSLKAGYLLGPDRTGRFLAVQSSRITVARDAAGIEPLLHFDYERDKAHGYPEGHIQICATSPAWDAVAGTVGRELAKLHLPVGGRRFRPSLEDVVEFLVVEGLAEARPGWRELVERGRSRYRRIQGPRSSGRIRIGRTSWPVSRAAWQGEAGGAQNGAAPGVGQRGREGVRHP